MTAGNELSSLRNLARAYGVETEYRDIENRRQAASPEALLAVLKALGAPVERIEDIPSARRERRQAHWKRPLEPVITAWNGASAEAELRLPGESCSSRVDCRVELETGEVRQYTIGLADSRTTQAAAVEGARYEAKALVIPGVMPAGYHRLMVEMAGGSAEALIISAPMTAYSPSQEALSGVWGAFLPLYALRTKRGWGSGDFSDLETLIEWVSSLSGGVVATLPFLASFLDEPCDPSPYTPASRLFWNEFYIDPTVVPEMMHCPEALAMAESTELRSEIMDLRSERLVDYRRQMALKRIVLEKLADSLTPNSGDRYEAFRDFIREHEGLDDYARFRAACEWRGGTWEGWPRAERDGVLREGDFSKRAQHYHAYVQWVADEQVSRLHTRAAEKGMRLYLDLPLGVHRYGYDTWHETGLFVPGVSAGAPPDTLFHRGQDWGFPPLHPEKMREQGHRYPIAYLRHHMQYSDILRVDHVMGVHHLFWVPEGMEATDGVYVRYPSDEIYAILSVESHKHRCLVVGENLGTVPEYVNEAMVQHNVHGLYVTQYEVPENSKGELRDVPSASVASLNTHDMPPFSAYWQSLDIERWAAMGLVTEAEARIRTAARHAAKRNLARFLERYGYLKCYAGDMDRVLEACLSFLAESPAEVLLVNLEDLWLETEQQNIPGVVDGHPNWQRKARYDFETFSRMPEVLELLTKLRRSRGLA